MSTTQTTTLICEVGNHPWERAATRGQVPKSCPAHRVTGGGRKTSTRCAVCGAGVIKTVAQLRSGLPTCSSVCRKVLQYGAGYYPAALTRPKPAVIKAAPSARPRFVGGTCALCGENFVIEWQLTARYCSNNCARSSRKAHRRAKQRSVYVEPVGYRTLLREGERTCYLCGKDVDPHDYAYQGGSDGRPAFVVGPQYPSLDHVIPLARGGEHSRENTRLAHLVCNSIKGAG